MIFSDSKILLFLLILPFMVFLFFCFQYIRSRSLFRVFNKEVFLKLAPSFSFYRKLLNFGLKIMGLFLMILALARPVLEDQSVVEKSQGLEIIIAVDVSQSMLTKDVSPNRLSLLKVELSRFLARSNRKDRIGLIAFAGSSFLLAPLTLDVNLIQNYLNSISTDIIGSQGTDFKSVFEQAQRSFEGGGVGNANQVLIIASDGENHEEGALQAARELRKQGVRIFTLGFGTREGGKIPLNQTYMKDRWGNEVQSQFKERILKEFAKIGEGAFYHVFVKSNFVEKLHDDLNSLDQYEFEGVSRAGQVEIFQYFLLFSLILIWIQWVLGKK